MRINTLKQFLSEYLFEYKSMRDVLENHEDIIVEHNSMRYYRNRIETHAISMFSRFVKAATLLSSYKNYNRSQTLKRVYVNTNSDRLSSYDIIAFNVDRIDKEHQLHIAYYSITDEYYPFKDLLYQRGIHPEDAKLSYKEFMNSYIVYSIDSYTKYVRKR